METFFFQAGDEKKNRFKSYYVVWKRDCEILFSFFQNSLNRTM